MPLFNKNEMNELLQASQIGLWKVEIEEGKPSRFFADEVMDGLLGVETPLTPEERYCFHTDHIHPEDREIFGEYSQKLKDGRAEVVYRYCHPVKGVQYVRCGGMCDPRERRFLCIKGTHQDISDVVRLEKGKVAEQRLAEENQHLKREQVDAEQFYRQLLKIQSCGIVAYKLPSYDILVMNDAAKKLYDFAPDEVVVQDRVLGRVQSILYEDEIEIRRNLEKLSREGGQYSFRIRIPHQDGSQVQVWVTTQLLELEKGEKIVISCLQDISTLSELKEDNIRLERQLDIIQSLAQTYHLIYYIDLRDKTFLEVGTQVEGIRERVGKAGNAEELLETFCQEFVLPEHQDEMRKFVTLDNIHDRLQDKLWISSQFEGSALGWSESYLIAARRDRDGDCEHVIWATQSIEEVKKQEFAHQDALRKATAIAQKANKAKTAFLFNLSHDIRTPMNAITGFTELLEKHYADREKSRDYINKIRNSSRVLLSLINNVLDVARIESGRVALEEITWSVLQFNDILFSMFSEQMRQKNITFERKIEIQHEYVLCDAVNLRKIFLNIISNAYKYTPEGGRVTFTLKELPSNRTGYALFETTVADTGRGMSAEYLPHLFEEFVREEQENGEKAIEGTGLGMPIVKKLVDLMGGTILVKSELGKGSTFTVRLYHRVSDETGLKKVETVELAPERLTGKRILLAEDNDLNAEIAAEILGEGGLLVERAENGAQCVEMLEEAEPNYYDLILMDIQMPKMNGYEATEKIRQMQDETKAAIPILAMTANAFEEDKQAAFRAGMNGHIAKPFSLDALMETIARILL